MARWSYVVKFIAVGWIHFFRLHTRGAANVVQFLFLVEIETLLRMRAGMHQKKKLHTAEKFPRSIFPNVFIVSRTQDILSIFHSTRASWSIKRRFSRALSVVIKNNYFICEIHFCCLVGGDWKVRNPIIIGPRQSVNGFQQSKQRRRGDIVNCEEKNIDSCSSALRFIERRKVTGEFIAPCV